MTPLGNCAILLPIVAITQALPLRWAMLCYHPLCSTATSSLPPFAYEKRRKMTTVTNSPTKNVPTLIGCAPHRQALTLSTCLMPWHINWHDCCSVPWSSHSEVTTDHNQPGQYILCNIAHKVFHTPKRHNNFSTWSCHSFQVTTKIIPDWACFLDSYSKNLLCWCIDVFLMSF